METWKYEPAADLDQTFIERLRNFPRQPDLFVYTLRSMAAIVVRIFLRLYNRLTVTGRENLPAEGSYVIVANHTSHLDTMCLVSAMPLARVHRTFPAAAADYFFVSVPRVALAAIVVNALPFSREIHIRQSLQLCVQLLQNPANALIIFPEGTRSTGGQLRRFKPGVGRLVAGTSIPVVPCYLDGAWRAWPKGKSVPRPRKIRLTIGRPLVFADKATDKNSMLQISAALHDAVRELAPDGAIQ